MWAIAGAGQNFLPSWVSVLEGALREVKQAPHMGLEGQCSDGLRKRPREGVVTSEASSEQLGGGDGSRRWVTALGHGQTLEQWEQNLPWFRPGLQGGEEAEVRGAARECQRALWEVSGCWGLWAE